MTTDIVVVYKEDGKYFYKPMNAKTISKKVEAELKKNIDTDYSICQTAKLRPKDGEEPNKDGYYTQDQIDYEMVDVSEGGELVKKHKGNPDYFNHKTKIYSGGLNDDRETEKD